MATISIGHRPDLTIERARDLFASYFAGRYEVIPAPVQNRDFLVKQSAWTGVGVRLKQERRKTTFVFTALVPNLILHNLVGGLGAYLFLRSDWKAMEAEVSEFIRNELTVEADTIPERAAA